MIAAIVAPVKAPTAVLVAAVLGSALHHREAAAGATRYGFTQPECRTIVAGKRWACTVAANRLPGHLILFERVTWKRHVGFDFGTGVEL